jgi:Flp pilus assembly protein TadG
MTRRNRRNLLRDDHGIAAVEFALIFPVALTLMFGMAAVSERIQATHKIERAANTIADLAAAKTTGGDGVGEAAITDSDLSDLFRAAEFLISPLPTNNLKIDVYHIIVMGTSSRTAKYTANVTWKASQNGLGLLSCSPLSAGPEGAPDKIAGEYLANDTGSQRYLIVAHVSYDYSSPFGPGLFNWGQSSTTRIFRSAYAQPRNLFGLGAIQNKASTAKICTFAME